MSVDKAQETSQKLIDQYNNVFYLKNELSRGGQGVVYRTTDVDLAIKQPLDLYGNPDTASDLQSRFENIRLLPIPQGCQITLPLSILKTVPGYVMRLLDDMSPFEEFTRFQTFKKNETDLKYWDWVSEVPDADMQKRLAYYSYTGSTKKRLGALASCAVVLARLHGAGLVYGDISYNNCFYGQGKDLPTVWLIDADNLRLESPRFNKSVYTQRFAAPEVVAGKDCNRLRSDCWAFAVMAFELLSLTHPFIGDAVENSDWATDDWDADNWDNDSGNATLSANNSAESRAFSGQLPFIDDLNDDSNRTQNGLGRDLVLTPQLTTLFHETFTAGRIDPFRRPTMFYWALELTRAFDESIVCPKCGMSYYYNNRECPYCDSPAPRYILLKTKRWQKVYSSSEISVEIDVPDRCINHFSLLNHDNPCCRVTVDFEKNTLKPLPGEFFPDELNYEFNKN